MPSKIIKLKVSTLKKYYKEQQTVINGTHSYLVWRPLLKKKKIFRGSRYFSLWQCMDTVVQAMKKKEWDYLCFSSFIEKKNLLNVQPIWHINNICKRAIKKKIKHLAAWSHFKADWELWCIMHLFKASMIKTNNFSFLNILKQFRTLQQGWSATYFEFFFFLPAKRH